MAAEKAPKAAPLVLLLKGLYSPLVDGPIIGLSTVDLSDGSYSTTKIYPVIGTPGHTNVLEAIGDFYVQFTGMLCAYDLPRRRDRDGVHAGLESHLCSRRVWWVVPAGDLRTDHPGGERRVSIFRGRS